MHLSNVKDSHQRCHPCSPRPERFSDIRLNYTRPGLDDDPAFLVLGDVDPHLGVRDIHEAGVSVHLLACARDTDWLYAAGKRQAWNEYIDMRQRVLRGMSMQDAGRVVAAWRSLGPDGLGKLAAIPSVEEQARKLHEAAKRQTPG